MTNAYVVTGMLSDGKTVELDEPIPVRGGKVRVTVEVTQAIPPSQTLQEWLDDLRRRQAARGHVPMTVEQVQSYIEEERASWED